MAKKKQQDEDILKNLAEKLGGEVVAEAKPVTHYIDTGNLAMNFICSSRFIGGGIPGGKITEFYGPSASAKSLWALSILSGTQKMGGFAVLIDAENSLNPEFAARAGHVDTKRLLRFKPPTLERCFSKITNVVREIRNAYGPGSPICVVYDSIAVSPCERELRETELPDEYTKEQFKQIVGAKQQPGERARVIGDELRKIVSILEKFDATLFIINQTRSKIGVLYGNPETRTGGQALEFYSDLMCRTSAHKKIEDKKLRRPIGVNIKVANKKNRHNSPFITIPSESNDGGIPLYFSRGIDPLGGLLTALIQAERIEGKSGNYTIKEPWAGGKEIKFKASMAKNKVPFEILLECPAVIDANSPEEVNEYFKDFLEAMALSDNENISEVDIGDEDEDLLGNYEG